jgi:hypothetical protein
VSLPCSAEQRIGAVAAEDAVVAVVTVQHIVESAAVDRVGTGQGLLDEHIVVAHGLRRACLEQPGGGHGRALQAERQLPAAAIPDRIPVGGRGSARDTSVDNQAESAKVGLVKGDTVVPGYAEDIVIRPAVENDVEQHLRRGGRRVRNLIKIEVARIEPEVRVEDGHAVSPLPDGLRILCRY